MIGVSENREKSGQGKQKYWYKSWGIGKKTYGHKKRWGGNDKCTVEGFTCFSWSVPFVAFCVTLFARRGEKSKR